MLRFKNIFCFTYSPHQIVLSVPCLLYTSVKYSTAASFISTTLQQYYWAVIVFDVYVDDVPTAYTWVLLDAVMKTVWWKLLFGLLIWLLNQPILSLPILIVALPWLKNLPSLYVSRGMKTTAKIFCKVWNSWAFDKLCATLYRQMMSLRPSTTQIRTLFFLVLQ